MQVFKRSIYWWLPGVNAEQWGQAVLATICKFSCDAVLSCLQVATSSPRLSTQVCWLRDNVINNIFLQI